jgi:hypothetical protein
MHLVPSRKVRLEHRGDGVRHVCRRDGGSNIMCGRSNGRSYSEPHAGPTDARTADAGTDASPNTGASGYAYPM